MIQNLFPLLAALILAAPARAVVVAPAGESAHAWVSPVAGVFASVGAERIAALGMPSLTALSTLDSSARYSFAANPQVLDLLVKQFRLNPLPVASFALMSTEDKLIILSAAAKGAEIEAAAIADESLAAAKSRPLHPSSADAVSKQVSQAEAVALYLDAPRREETARMRSRVASFQSKWRKLVKKFQEELPLKIAAGTFDAGNILVETKHGWVAADESPYPIETDLSKFYERRTEALRKAPRGPWVIQEASPLLIALSRPEVGGGKSWSAAARLELADIISSSDERARADRSLMKAAGAFVKNDLYGYAVAPRHILAVEKRYEDILNFGRMSTSTRLRVLATIRNGADGLPSWERLREIELSTYGRTRRVAMIAAGVLIAGMISMMFLGGIVAAMPLAAKLAAFSLAWLAPMIVFVRGLWLAQSLESARDHSGVAETLRRTFKND